MRKSKVLFCLNHDERVADPEPKAGYSRRREESRGGKKLQKRKCKWGRYNKKALSLNASLIGTSVSPLLRLWRTVARRARTDRLEKKAKEKKVRITGEKQVMRLRFTCTLRESPGLMKSILDVPEKLDQESSNHLRRGPDSDGWTVRKFWKERAWRKRHRLVLPLTYSAFGRRLIPEGVPVVIRSPDMPFERRRGGYDGGAVRRSSADAQVRSSGNRLERPDFSRPTHWPLQTSVSSIPMGLWVASHSPADSHRRVQAVQ